MIKYAEEKHRYGNCERCGENPIDCKCKPVEKINKSVDKQRYQIAKEVLEEYENTPFSSPEYMTFDLTNWLQDKIK